MVLMPNTRFAEGMVVAGKIRRVIAGLPLPHSFESRFNVTASLGMVSVTPDTVLIDELLAKTHHVLYKSKMTGKNRISYDANIVGSLPVEEEDNFSNILKALKKHEDYSVVRQPIFLLADQSTVGYEFLSRFSVKGLEMPDDFFRVCRWRCCHPKSQIEFRGVPAETSRERPRGRGYSRATLPPHIARFLLRYRRK